jgi:type I restriction enzyme S subunit
MVPDDVPPNMIASTNYDQFVISPEVDHRFFWWQSHSPSFAEAIRSSAAGVVIEKMVFNRDAWLEKTIALPPLEEQRRIVARIEELVAMIHEARALRHQASEDVQTLVPSLVRSLLREAEDKYTTKLLLDVCDFEGGSQPPKSMFRYEPTPGYVRFLQIRDFSSDEHLTFIPDSPRNSTVKPYEVLVGRYGASLGKILRGKAGAYNVAMCKAVPIRTDVDRDFLAYTLAHGHFQERLAEISRSAQAGFNKNDLKGVRIVLPSLPEQRRIVAYLDDLQTKVDALKGLQHETATELDALLPSILDKAFKGRL